jgi:hypothetical protein
MRAEGERKLGTSWSSAPLSGHRPFMELPMHNPIAIRHQIAPLARRECERLAQAYHANEPEVLEALGSHSPEQWLRLFVTSHGMPPVGIWQTHTYARFTDSVSGRDHFFLIPLPYKPHKRHETAVLARPRPSIRIENGSLWIDQLKTGIRLQAIPHTTPFWYFHYNPNREHRPYHSMTLNLKPACPEKCTLCAGAKTGRVNNGMEGALEAVPAFERILAQHPETAAQLDSVAVVTGCFEKFDALVNHLREVRAAALKFASPSTFRVLEHNVGTEEQLEIVVGELGYEVFVTLECFDQELRCLALNGKVGRKGRDSRQFLEMIRTYAWYLEKRPGLGKRHVRVTYLIGIDSLETTERLFRELDSLNRELKHSMVVPWMSVFTPYDDHMRVLQQPGFSLKFLLDAHALARKYFSEPLLREQSGSTGEGYARGFF